MECLKRVISKLKDDLQYVKDERYKIFSAGHVNVYKSHVRSTIGSSSGEYGQYGEYTVVAVSRNSNRELESEVIAFHRATSCPFQFPFMLTGVDVFSQGQDICFRYFPCDGDLRRFVETVGYKKEVFRDLCYAIDFMHYTKNMLHGNLKNCQKITIVRVEEKKSEDKKTKDSKFALTLRGFGEDNEMTEVKAIDESRDLAGILERLPGEKPAYFRALNQHLRIFGCRNLHDAFFFLEVEEKWTYLDVLFREVRDSNRMRFLHNWYGQHNEPDWRVHCKTNMALGHFYAKSTYYPGAFEFLRFSRNVSQHCEEASLTEDKLMEELYLAWPRFFDWLHFFCAQYCIPIYVLKEEKYG